LIELAVTAIETQESGNSIQIHPAHSSVDKDITRTEVHYWKDMIERQTSWSNTVKSSRQSQVSDAARLEPSKSISKFTQRSKLRVEV